MRALRVATLGLLPLSPLSLATEGLLGQSVVAPQQGGGWFQPQKTREAAKLLQDRQKRAMQICMLSVGADLF
jgi:hypothetical protein